MLETLSIDNIVLISKLNLSFERGLCVLTGETGSGKSILLDALGLALGYRSNSRLLRNGEEKGLVVANFNIKTNQRAKEHLKEMGIEFDDNIIIRRVIYSDGHSKAFVNDIEITQKFLQNLGESLLEIHGQNEQIGLLNPSFHRDILDSYANLIDKRKEVSNIFLNFRNTKEKLQELIEQKAKIEEEQDYLKHIISEIESLNIQDNEEDELNNKRIQMMNKEKVVNILKDVKSYLEGQFDISKNLLSAQHTLNKAITLDDDFSKIIELLEQANENINEVNYSIEKIYDRLGFDGVSLDEIEEKLFAIRGLARKLNVTPNLLNDLCIELKQKLDRLNEQEVNMESLQKESIELKQSFLDKARNLSELRKENAQKLSAELLNELIPLKMEKTTFEVEFKELDENNWNKYGIDSVKFIASTNPGVPMDELSKIASGGELSRFMLALKVVLSKTQSVPTLIFDEIDTGIGGAVADAVGERLKKLGQNLQVLVVTHLAQVASKSNHHLRVRKEQQTNQTNTVVEVLSGDDKVREIARMFSGETITDEAMAVAKKMLE
ncbi:MAG: DNA repair protein RecN [Rickettsiales bacterium]|nr:DNA repair protein RecN [Rickettsiales bacterium]